MWRLVRKKNESGEVVRRKSRWVCFGNHQEEGKHYYDTYSSVGQNESMKVILAMAVQFGWSVFQFDVETAFLYGDIDATVHVSQVSGFEIPGKEDWVWRLNKSLYRTKQAPRCWKKHLTDTLGNLGMLLLRADESLFLNKSKSLLLHIHVDNGLIVGKSRSEVVKFLSNLQSTYKIKSTEKLVQHLG